MSLGRLFVWLQYVLPQHALSRLILRATRVRTPWFKNCLVRGFLNLYAVDMREAAQSDPYSGAIEGEQLLQAKNRRYTLSELLAAQPWAGEFAGGSFATIYLAPFNYHRVHSPLRGQLRETVYVPGRLFSVNGVTASHVPRLFARNERVLTFFDSEFGRFALVLVGALNVGSIATVWAGDITPASRRIITRLPPQPVELEKGAEIGRFNMGSTVILLFQANRARWHGGVRTGASVRLGQSLGTLE